MDQGNKRGLNNNYTCVCLRDKWKKRKVDSGCLVAKKMRVNKREKIELTYRVQTWKLSSFRCHADKYIYIYKL